MKHFLLALIALGFSQAAFAADPVFTSQYTSLEEPPCKSLPMPQREPEDDSISLTCPGRDGFEIGHVGGDLRSWLTFKKKGGVSLDTMDNITLVPGSFPHVTGTKLEWRYKDNQLIGWIFRMAANQEDKGKNVSKLFVVKLDTQKACMLGAVDTNEEAHKKLDQSKGCP